MHLQKTETRDAVVAPDALPMLGNGGMEGFAPFPASPGLQGIVRGVVATGGQA